MSDFWQVEVRPDGVATAVYRNDPMNYFVGSAAEELGGLIERWAEPDVRAVVLSGAPEGRFITHYSVEELLGYARDRESLDEVGPALTAGYHQLLEGLRGLPKPVVCALTGDTMGGGFELSLACDIRVAQDGPYRIGLLETRLGIMPGGGGTQRLARMVGAAAAIDIVLRGRVFHPAAALRRGLVHEVADDARARAVEIAADLASLSPVALAQVKRAIYGGVELPLDAGRELEGACFTETMRSDEAVRAMAAYVDTPLADRASFAPAED